MCSRIFLFAPPSTYGPMWDVRKILECIINVSIYSTVHTQYRLQRIPHPVDGSKNGFNAQKLKEFIVCGREIERIDIHTNTNTRSTHSSTLD